MRVMNIPIVTHCQCQLSNNDGAMHLMFVIVLFAYFNLGQRWQIFECLCAAK